ncbi:MAG: peptidoglycan bridge formation glycyltransferase FemA/FemB family protein [Anaerolineae bacterium]|nr:peptidoglycan bridge formation glycyltransferase FemA/FemB family protein [Anaerolineae bacterium]
MQITYLSSAQRDKWDNFVAQSSSFMLMQSWEWGSLKETRGWRALRVAVADNDQLVAGAQVLVRPMPLGLGCMAYVPRGPIGNWLSDEVAALLLNELQHIACEYKTLFLRIEPAVLHSATLDPVLKQFGFVASKFTNQPRATVILDLSPDLADIMASMKKNAQRIRHAERCGVTVRTGNEEDLPAFYKLMQETGNRCGFLPRPSDYYAQQWRAFACRDEAVLLLGYYQDQLLGARMSFRFADRAAALHACSSPEHSGLRANWLLAWEEIKWAKSMGCRSLDLWGIPDEVGEAAYQGKELPKTGPAGGLWGVYQFKRGFTDHVVYHAGAYDYVQAPLLYYPAMRILNNQYLDRLTAKIDSIKYTTHQG